MGRAPCCDKANVKKGPWSPEEDSKLKDYIEKYGTGGNWIALPLKAGLRRCGKSCRLRWLNYLRPNIKHGEFSDEEDRAICTLFANIGSRWSIIASQLPGRTDNDIKNYWNTKLKKKLMAAGSYMHLLPSPPQPPSSSSSSSNFSLFPVPPPTSFYNNIVYPDHLNVTRSINVPIWETGNNNNNNSSYLNMESQNQLMMFQGSYDNYNNARDVITCSNSSDGSLKEVRQEGILGISNQSCELEADINQTSFILHNYNNNNNNNHDVIQQGYFGDNTNNNNIILNNNNNSNSCLFSTSHDQYYGY